MGGKLAFSDIRNVKISFVNTAGAMSTDAFKAAISKVEEIEYERLKNPALANLTSQPTVFTGTSRYKLYSFTLTAILTTGTYTFTYVETVPNADSLS